MRFKVGDVLIYKYFNTTTKYTIENVIHKQKIYVITGYGGYSSDFIDRNYEKYSYRVEKLERLLR